MARSVAEQWLKRRTGFTKLSSDLHVCTVVSEMGPLEEQQVLLAMSHFINPNKN